MIRQERWVNTSPGHNKDYIITFDDESFEVKSEWGVIGGARRSAHLSHHNTTDMMTTITGKRERRARGGYSLVSSDIWDPAVRKYAPAVGMLARKSFVADFSVDERELV